jgi:hypothetical protein
MAVIFGEIKIIAALAAAMFGLALLLVTLLYTGTWLFVGEWLFGSIGWGLLHGALVTIALIAVLGLTLVSGEGRSGALGFVAAVVVGVLVSLLLASNVLRGSAEWMAEQFAASVSIDAAALQGIHLTFVVMALATAVLGFLLGLRAGIAGALTLVD